MGTIPKDITSTTIQQIIGFAEIHKQKLSSLNTLQLYPFWQHLLNKHGQSYFTVVHLCTNVTN